MKKLDVDQILLYPIACLVVAAGCLWYIHQGEAPPTVVAVGIATVVMMMGAVTIRLMRVDPAKRARQLEEASRGFPWRSFGKDNAVAVGLVVILALRSNVATLVFAAVLFASGNALFVLQWRLRRRVAQRTQQQVTRTS